MKRAIQSVLHQTMVFNLKACLEDKWGYKIPAEHAVLPWMVELVGVLLNRPGFVA